MSRILAHYKYQKYLEDVKKENEEKAKKYEDKLEKQVKDAFNIVNKYK